MASETLSLYAAELSSIQQAISSKDQSLLARVEDENQREYLRKIFLHEYERDPETFDHPEGHEFIRAFEALVEIMAGKPLVLECYSDEEATPELWKLAWGGDLDEFDLPLSPYGAPAVSFQNPDQLRETVSAFKQVQAEGGYERQEMLSNTDLDSLITFLQKAADQNLGVFIFIGQ